MTTLTSLLAAHLDGSATISQTIAASYARHRAHGDDAIFITLRPEAEVLAEAEALQAEGPRGRALWGIPVAVKDNIDVAGLPTTAACPAFAFTPARDATVVARLRAAGAIVIGKTNLDQFATGLNGTRSPYGVPRNALRADLVPGGSSSGSASAVAAAPSAALVRNPKPRRVRSGSSAPPARRMPLRRAAAAAVTGRPAPRSAARPPLQHRPPARSVRLARSAPRAMPSRVRHAPSRAAATRMTAPR